LIDPSNVSFKGEKNYDVEIMSMLPSAYRELLQWVNGCILFQGGLHIRGACTNPDWHSRRRAWIGSDALWSRYSTIDSRDVPFAQDFLGDQFLLRRGCVYRLQPETDELFSLAMTWQEFLHAAQRNPVDFLSLNLLMRFQDDGSALQPGQLLSVYPPLFATEAASGVSLRAVSAFDRLGYLANMAKQVRSLSEGQKIKFTVT
jgi:SMI1/KNR4 family protein SUKH-1